MSKEAEENKEVHVLHSNNRIIFAADMALSALEEHFKDISETDYWHSIKLQRAALETALASLFTPT
ncbi:TPA: hypothetical protein NDT40_002805 [Klebsiella oxytoca]|nr:hypothetical protein [Klebsiella oxytoca]